MRLLLSLQEPVWNPVQLCTILLPAVQEEVLLVVLKRLHQPIRLLITQVRAMIFRVCRMGLLH